MMGLEIYNSEGFKTFGNDSSVLYYAGTDTIILASMSDRQLSEYFRSPPPYVVSILSDGGHNTPVKSNGTTFYHDKYLPLRQTPLDVYPMEPFGLQTWDENGTLELDPRRRPLVVEEIKYVEGTLTSRLNSSARHIYDLWEADGYGVLYLDLKPRLTFTETDTSIGYEFLAPTVRRINGSYRLEVTLEYYATGDWNSPSRTSRYRGVLGKVKTFR